ncbi:MAG: twin-arginine translocase TatA/TatE family subunit [Armatimonadetes bacterium]|nr:twin-arginine translocase TatA/TatE family subunit [Armatimonadota bacterium]
MLNFNPTSLLAFGLGAQELMIVLVIILVLFGGAKIPQLMRGVGKGVGELQKGLEEGKKAMSDALEADKREEAARPAPSNTEPRS